MRLTYDNGHEGKQCWQIHGADNRICSEVCIEQGTNGCEQCPINRAFEKLAAYEDTGLEPHEIAELFVEGKIPPVQEIKAAKRLYKGTWEVSGNGSSDV